MLNETFPVIFKHCREAPKITLMHDDVVVFFQERTYWAGMGVVLYGSRDLDFSQRHFALRKTVGNPLSPPHTFAGRPRFS